MLERLYRDAVGHERHVPADVRRPHQPRACENTEYPESTPRVPLAVPTASRAVPREYPESPAHLTVPMRSSGSAEGSSVSSIAEPKPQDRFSVRPFRSVPSGCLPTFLVRAFVCLCIPLFGVFLGFGLCVDASVSAGVFLRLLVFAVSLFRCFCVCWFLLFSLFRCFVVCLFLA